MGLLAHVVLVPWYVLLGLYALAAACVTAGCLGVLGLVLVRDAGAGVFDRRLPSGPGPGPQ